MECKDFQEIMGGLPDGAFSHGFTLELEQHRDGCPACGVAYAQLLDMMEKLRRLPVIEPAADFEDQVLARARREVSAQAWTRPSANVIPARSAWFTRVGRMAAAILLTILTGAAISVVALNLLPGNNGGRVEAAALRGEVGRIAKTGENLLLQAKHIDWQDPRQRGVLAAELQMTGLSDRVENVKERMAALPDGEFSVEIDFIDVLDDLVAALDEALARPAAGKDLGIRIDSSGVFISCGQLARYAEPGAPIVVSTVTVGGDTPDVQAYLGAKSKFYAGDYVAASAEFERMVMSYPDSALADDALIFMVRSSEDGGFELTMPMLPPVIHVMNSATAWFDSAEVRGEVEMLRSFLTGMTEEIVLDPRAMRMVKPELAVDLREAGRRAVLLRDSELEMVLRELEASGAGPIQLRRRGDLLYRVELPLSAFSKADVMNRIMPWLLQYPTLFQPAGLPGR